jgi:DNA-directed RNA polymerase specialized sigma24 family protein
MAIIETSRRLRSIVTRKSMLPRLVDKDSPDWASSWQFLFSLYMPAMVRYVKSVLSRALKRPADNDEAQDIVQDYFSQCLEKDWLTRDVESIRCFRAYLQMQLKRFVYKHLEHKFAQKRNPGALASAEALEGVMGNSVDPSTADLDEGWVAVAVEQALAELRQGNEIYAEVIADLLRTDGEGSPDLAERLGQSSQQLTHLRHRARKRFGTLFHEQLRQTVLDDEAFEELCQRLESYLP